MLLNKLFRKIRINRPINVCSLCSKPLDEVTDLENVSLIKPDSSEESTTEKIKEKKIRPPSKQHLKNLQDFFSENPHLLSYKDVIPHKFLFQTIQHWPEHMYLICPKIAEKVANHVLPTINQNKNQIVAESNPGFGFISNEIIKQGFSAVRLYEHNEEFREIIKQTYDKNQDVKLYNKDFFYMYRYSYIDRFDQGDRVPDLLKDIPKKSWIDEPIMTIVGTMTNMFFIKYLIKSIIMQRELATNGRVELFILTFSRNWDILNSTVEDNLRLYRPWTIMFRIFFEAKLLNKFPRKFFVPWRKASKTPVEEDDIYLIQISMRKNPWISGEEFVPFYCFIKTLYTNGTTAVIPTCEKWVPGCGLSLMVPKLKHEDYFEEITIYTQFRELNPKQIIAVFREIAALPGYDTSPFMDMVEQELIKSETVTSADDEANQEREKKRRLKLL